VLHVAGCWLFLVVVCCLLFIVERVQLERQISRASSSNVSWNKRTWCANWQNWTAQDAGDGPRTHQWVHVLYQNCLWSVSLAHRVSNPTSDHFMRRAVTCKTAPLLSSFFCSWSTAKLPDFMIHCLSGANGCTFLIGRALLFMLMKLRSNRMELSSPNRNVFLASSSQLILALL
jgi:hypothetical protein